MRNGFVRLVVESLEPRDNPSSFWDNTLVGNVLSGVVQGGANLVNGVQDAAIGDSNLPAVVYNNTAGNLGGGQIGYIPSPDWSLDLIVENDPLHGTSKFLGGTGVVMLATIGVGSLAGAEPAKRGQQVQSQSLPKPRP